jgi:AcrR family transcriptional regulator
VKRDAQATRTRILASATSEFATFGMAGARVDRIAAGAAANKNMIYVYFGNKDQLFDAVFADAIRDLLDTVAIDAQDLPGYAAALFDHIDRHPELSRLARWQGLERPGAIERLEAAVSGTAAKIEALAAAQAAGLVNDRMTPDQLLSLVFAVAATWSAGAPELSPDATSTAMTAARLAAVVLAVERLIAPDAHHP